MEYGIVNATLAAVRREPSHRSEMITQALFGDHFAVIDRVNAWQYIRLMADDLTGWVHQNPVVPLSEEEFKSIGTPFILPRQNSAVPLKGAANPIPLMPGSSLPFFNHSGNVCYIGKAGFRLTEKLSPGSVVASREAITETAISYLNAPFLWGGKTPYGIDCSGLVQVVFRIHGIHLPREADRQVREGNPVNFPDEARPGDLAFFEDEPGHINHTGIVTGKNLVLHTFGTVRLDTIDHQGIFRPDPGGYTHQLRVIKNIIDPA